MLTTHHEIINEKTYAYFNQAILESQFYLPMTFEQFKYLSQTHYVMIHVTDDQIQGLLMGSFKDNACYIAYLLGTKAAQYALLNDLEYQLRTTSIQTLWWSYNNPIKVPFYTNPPHIHFNAQGVLKDSPIESLLLSSGYQIYATMDTYEVDLTSFQKNDYLAEKTIHLKQLGIEFVVLNECTKSVDDFLQLLPNPAFVDVIRHGIAASKPILFVMYNGSIMGFTGPISVDTDGRGVFGGIEILDALQGYGAGKLLFFKLLQTFKDMGATYVTLFTGQNNPAKHIYRAAGCQITHTFHLLKKELYR